MKAMNFFICFVHAPQLLLYILVVILCSCDTLDDETSKLKGNCYNESSSSISSQNLRCVPGISGMGAPTGAEVDLMMKNLHHVKKVEE